MAIPTLPLSPPSIAGVLGHVVAVCNCDAHLVVIIPMVGNAECSSCKQQWRIKKLHYDVEDQEGHLECTIEPVKRVVLGGASQFSKH